MPRSTISSPHTADPGRRTRPARRARRRGSAPLLNVAVDEGEGDPVVLIHGIASSSAAFHQLVPLLTQRHRVIAIDLLGFGASPAPPDSAYTLEEHVAALRATLRALGLPRPFALVGHSLGSLIAARYAADHPKAVSELILASPPIYAYPASLSNRRTRTRVSLYLRAYQYLRENKEFTIRNGNMLATIVRGTRTLTFSESNWTPFVRSLENCIESPTIISDLASIDIPVQIVYGSLDAFLVPGSLAVAARMRHVRVHRVNRADHSIRKRMARVVAAAIESA